MAESEPTTLIQLTTALDEVAAVQDPNQWDPFYYWPPKPTGQPNLIASYIAPDKDQATLVFDEPLDSAEPDDGNFLVDVTAEDEGNVLHTVITEVTLAGDNLVVLDLTVGDEDPGTPQVLYTGAANPPVLSAAGKEANPGSVYPFQNEP